MMNALIQRWQALAPREQWLSFGVGLALLIMLYVLLLAEPLGLRIAAEKNSQQQAQARTLQAQSSLQDIRSRLAADPNLSYRQALKAAQASRDELHQRIDLETSTLVSPEKMKALLQDLLRNQAKLKLVALQSSSAPLELPGAAAPAAQEQQASPVVFYRHGLQLTLEGGYFDLLSYLKAIEASGWRLHWDRLDYEVGEEGHERARVTLDLHTLSRDAGWVGV